MRLSLLATGDTGAPPFLTHRFHRQRTVAAGLEAEDRHLPVDALVLLGDNFYGDGLREEEIEKRVRNNVVRPYCRFVALRGPRSASVRDVCPEPEEERHPVPLYVVLGNHDYNSEASPDLQRSAVPEFVSNWTMPEALAAAYELGSGVGLVLFDSVLLREGADPEPLQEALREVEGEWKILAAHHPVARARDLREKAAALQHQYRERVMEVLEEAGVFVHLFLAGHEHNLQVISMARPAPPLHVVAGSGSKVRRVRTTNPNARFTLAELGFVRIDVVGSGAAQRLVVSLFSTPGNRLWARRTRKLVSRWAVTRDGSLREIPLLESDETAYGARTSPAGLR